MRKGRGPVPAPALPQIPAANFGTTSGPSSTTFPPFPASRLALLIESFLRVERDTWEWLHNLWGVVGNENAGRVPARLRTSIYVKAEHEGRTKAQLHHSQAHEHGPGADSHLASSEYDLSHWGPGFSRTLSISHSLDFSPPRSTTSPAKTKNATVSESQ